MLVPAKVEIRVQDPKGTETKHAACTANQRQVEDKQGPTKINAKTHAGITSAAITGSNGKNSLRKVSASIRIVWPPGSDPTESVYECVHCGEKLKRKDSMILHMSTHNDILNPQWRQGRNNVTKNPGKASCPQPKKAVLDSTIFPRPLENLNPRLKRVAMKKQTIQTGDDPKTTRPQPKRAMLDTAIFPRPVDNLNPQRRQGVNAVIRKKTKVRCAVKGIEQIVVNKARRKNIFQERRTIKSQKTQTSDDPKDPFPKSGMTFIETIYIQPGDTYCLLKVNQSTQTEESPQAYYGGNNCLVCAKSFLYEVSLNNHRKEYHEDERPFSCAECGAKFKSAGYLSHHKNTQHIGGKRMNCPICNKTFRYVEALQKHQLTHPPDEESLTCAQCGQSFIYKVSLENHRLTHPQEAKRKLEEDIIEEYHQAKRRPRILRKHHRALSARAVIS